MSEGPRVSDRLPQSMPVLYVASEVADAGVENVVQRVLSKK